MKTLDPGVKAKLDSESEDEVLKSDGNFNPYIYICVSYVVPGIEKTDCSVEESERELVMPLKPWNCRER